MTTTIERRRTMKAEIKEKWITALESGKYKQGQFGLRYVTGNPGGDSFCCLGVLADIVAPELWERNERDQYVFGEKLDDIYNNVELPSCEFLNEVGLSKEQTTHLTDLNDHDEATFPEIADYIRKEL